MYITHSYIGTNRGEVDYLIFYLTEEYIEEQVNFTQQIQPMLNYLGEHLLNKGAVVQSFKNKIGQNNEELLQKWKKIFEEDQYSRRLYNDVDRPALLIINTEINNLTKDNFLLISLRDFEENGNFNIYEIKEFFQTLIEIVHSDIDLIEQTKKNIKRKNLKDTKTIMNINPSLFGVGINGKEAMKAFKKFIS